MTERKKEMDYTIRRITKDDKAVFIEMSREFYSSEAVLNSIDDSFHFNTFDELMRSDVYLECFIFETDKGEIAGYALLDKMFSHEVGGMLVWVEELYVRPGFQGHGIGNSFFAYLEKNVPAARYRLETEPENEGARALYRRKGFRELEYLQMVKDICEK